ncbi:MAG: DNA methyltransferase [Methylophilaceae bacterium]
MPLSWNEIKTRASTFAKHWADAANEDSQAKPFLIDFFEIFGITNKRVATFEHAVIKHGAYSRDNTENKSKHGYVDLFWPGIMLVEMKSKGKDLARAYTQAIDYFAGIQERDLPRYVLVCDFQRFQLHDLNSQTVTEFALKDLYQNVKSFGFIAGYQTQIIKPQDPINIKAAERMGKLHDALKAVGYTGHALEVYLVRLLFCLFAEDTTIFQKKLFQDYIEINTKPDGSDLAHHISTLFYVLNTPESKRLSNLEESLNAFPYVNGKLFEETLPPAQFDSKMREALLDLCALDWSIISPAIFGSLFQSIMDADARRNLGAHYTSEENILKLIKPLFLDALWAEFTKVKANKNRLQGFHQKLRTLTFFDPACGCGNFLVITYRELRLLELELLRASHQTGQLVMDVQALINVDVDQFYGIEIEEFPAQIAQVALWLTDHQMNMQVSEEFGAYFARIPLKATPHIVHGNALQTDWQNVLPAERCSFILGNPPFLGKSNQSASQKADMQLVCGDIKNAGLLDFVAAWYIKAARYIKQTPSHAGSGQSENYTEKPHKLTLPKEQLVFIRSLRANQTDAENLMWALLRDRRLANAKFRRQHPVGKYVLDFYCHEAKLAIELDGSQHLESAHDQVRDAYLQQQGITVLRYWNNDVLNRTESVLEDAWNQLQQHIAPSPQPSPTGRGSENQMSGNGNMPEIQPFSTSRGGDNLQNAWSELDNPSPTGRGEGVRVAFVSTNSITQGEQVGVL